jgi:hypothetical protein
MTEILEIIKEEFKSKFSSEYGDTNIILSV